MISYAMRRSRHSGRIGKNPGAGSLAAYCIGITGIDPIRYNLLFERFLNPERVSMPDFDIDFSMKRRPEMIEYVIQKYGSDHVAQIVTFGTMAARGSLRDVGRVMAIPYAEVDGIAKLVPMELNMTLDKALTASGELRQRYDTNQQVHQLVDMARAGGDAPQQPPRRGESSLRTGPWPNMSRSPRTGTRL